MVDWLYYVYSDKLSKVMFSPYHEVFWYPPSLNDRVERSEDPLGEEKPDDGANSTHYSAPDNLQQAYNVK